jgi:phenylacetate-coenzyme A ligase PaaK-like adenylate-forming protein
MYSFFHPELAAVALQVHDEQLCYETGGYSARDVAAVQRDRFNSIVDYAHSNSKFYSPRLDAFVAGHLHGFELEDVNHIPFTTKDDLRMAQHDIVSQPLEKAWVYYETTGTTGPSTPCPRNDIDSIVNNTALILRYRKVLAQHGDVHVIGIMGPTELHSTGDTFEDVFRALGHTIVKMWPRSPLVGIERALNLIEDLGITVLVCTPGVAVELARHLIRVGESPAKLGLKCLLALGELVTPQLLANLGTIWNITIYNCMYASQEASILAVVCADGKQRTVPLNNYYELIDPDTTHRIEVPADGGDVRGELVVTNLYRGQKPLIRYRTGDMVVASATGDGGWVIEPIGRVLDIVELNGRKFTAYEVEASICEHLDGCLGYQISVTDREGEDVLDIVVEIPYSHDDSQVELLARRVELGLGVPTTVRRGETDSLTATAAMVSWKAARFHDRRPARVDHERAVAQRLAASRRP